MNETGMPNSFSTCKEGRGFWTSELDSGKEQWIGVHQTAKEQDANPWYICFKLQGATARVLRISKKEDIKDGC